MYRGGSKESDIV
jgi:hypothetical protein